MLNMIQLLQERLTNDLRTCKWKSLMANTVEPIFTPQQCQDIINMGHQQKAEEAKVGHKKGSREGKYDTKMRITTISWLPFSKRCRRCTKLLNKVCFKQIEIILVMKV